jgi:predicted glycoside hydrolase/deacetylase ChbG (UPF0249 family)
MVIPYNKEQTMDIKLELKVKELEDIIEQHEKKIKQLICDMRYVKEVSRENSEKNKSYLKELNELTSTRGKAREIKAKARATKQYANELKKAAEIEQECR